jgi:hypothetical protein
MAAMLTMGVESCSDAEDGEDWNTWVMRNMLNSNWGLDAFAVGNDQYVRMGEPGFDFYFEMKLRANGRTFELERFFYNEEGNAEKSTRINKSGTFVIDEKNKAIEATDSEGNKCFRLNNIEFDTGIMMTTITFYDLNKSYNVILNRSLNLLIDS